MNNNQLSKGVKIFYYLYLIVFTFNISFSQTNSSYAPKVNNIPSSPEAALLGRFGDVPIGYYTGTANVSVPLYTIKENGVEIPVNLNYHGSGIKVADEATWVGLGWSLEPEGSISQEIRGKEDIWDNSNNYLGGYLDEYTAFKTRINNGAGYAEFAHRKIFQLGMAHWRGCNNQTGLPEGYTYDAHPIMGSLMQGNGEPDIYSYNFSGYSGKFFINPDTNKIVLIDKKDEIIFENLPGGTGFKATTPDGNIFIFDVIEKAYGIGAVGGPEYAGKTYKLSTIQLTNNKVLNFAYTNKLITSRFSSQDPIVLNYICNTNSPPDTHPIVMQLYNNSEVKMLQKITSNDVIINFNLGDRQDLMQNTSNVSINPQKLESIDIISAKTNKKIKSFKFGYSYFLSNETADSFTYLGKRLKLDFVKEIGYDVNETADNTKPAHLFEYDMSVQFPDKNSLAIDYWGYFNGQQYNTGLFPDLDYFNFYNKPSLLTSYTKSIRYADNTKAKAGLLKKITYPTGGFTEFYYEPNSFTNQFIPNNVDLSLIHKAPRILDRNVDYATGPTVSTPFALSKSVYIHFENKIFNGYAYPALPAATQYTTEEMQGSFIEFRKIKNGVESLIKRWDLTSVYNVDFERDHQKVWTEDIYVPYDNDPSVRYTVTAYMPGNKDTKPDDHYNVAMVQSMISYDDDTGVDASRTIGGGFRISNIKNYTKTGTIASNKKLLYINEDGTSSGKLLSAFKPFQELEMFCNYCGSPNNGLPTSRSTRFTEYLLSPTDFGMNGNIVGYSRVEEIELTANGMDNNGKKVYNYYNIPNITKKGFPMIEYQQNGNLLFETSFDKYGNKVKQEEHTYTNLQPWQIPFEGIKIIYHSIGGVDLGNPFATSDSGDSYVYTYETYPLNSYWYAKSSVLTTNYLNGGQLSNSESYIYNSKGKIRSVINKNSKNETIKSDSYYASDPEMSAKPNAFNLNAKNMISEPLVTRTFNGAQQLSEQETQFGLFGNLLLPQYVYAGKESATEKRATCDKYDSKANIQQYTLENGTFVTVLWGYNQTNPIAKIENASYLQVATALGITSLTLDTYNENNTSEIESLRSLLPNAVVTTYTYVPLIGVKTITDSKGLTTYYEYDSFNRLQYIKDQNFNVLQKYCYNYLGQQTDCTGSTTVTTYKNIYKSSTFTKEACGAGTIGSTYVYSVPAGIYSSTLSQADANAQADNEILANGQNFTNANAVCIELPSAPAGLAFNNATASTINFSWNAAARATGYKIYKDGIYVSSVTAPTTSGSLSGLNIATNYNVQVLGTIGSGEGVLCAPVAMSTLPTAPVGLTFSSATASTINFTWAAVTGATSYKIYKNGIYISTVTTTSGSLSGLSAATSYNVQVLATSISGDSALSNILPMSTVLAAPTGLSFTSATATSVNFSWSAVTGAVNYKIYSNGIYVTTVAAPTTTGSLTGLTSSTAYGVQVLASNASGDGAFSNSVSMSTLPAAPTGLTFNSATASSVNFSWSAVTGATSYKIYLNGTYMNTIIAPVTTGSLSGLVAGTTYGVQVIATNASGDGALSTSVSMTTLPAVPTGLLFGSATDSSINFSWTSVSGATGYKIYSNGAYVSSVAVPTTTATLSGLTIGTNYSVQILAYNGSGDGTLCAPYLMGTSPPPPTGLTFISSTSTSISMSWTAVAGATIYKIYKNGVLSDSSNTTTGSLSGLTGNTTYNVQVQSYSPTAGVGALSSAVSMSTRVATPTGLTFTSATQTTVNMSWAYVTGATGYKVYKNGVLAGTFASNTASLSGLNMSTSYSIQVLAYNANGDSGLSSAVSMTTISGGFGYYRASGAYPATNQAGLSGSICNNSTKPIYVYGVIQSSGSSTGYGTGSISINGVGVSPSGFFSSSTQSFVSGNYVMVPAGSAVTVTGNYYGIANSNMLLAYSLSPGGFLTYWYSSN